MDAAEDEIELKFLCEPADLAAVLAAAPAGDTQEKSLVSIYFDTPDGELRRQRISLRVRENAGKYVQTLKRGDGFAREEHEISLDGPELDRGLKALKEALPPRSRAALAPAFTVRVNRIQRTFEYGGARIEMALDLGAVQAGDRSRQISEVELELKAGGCAPMFELARVLGVAAPLYLSFDGKSTQGQVLADGTVNAPRRHDKTPLARGLTAAQAFQAIARNGLSQIAANAALLRQADSVEALHQLRVAVRRLRSAMSTFKSVTGGEEAAALKAELKWLAQACDEARDLDVFVLESPDLPAADLAALAPLVEAARQRGHTKACAAVGSGRFRDLVLEAVAWTETGAWLSAHGKHARRARDEDASTFAARALAHRRKVLLKAGRDLEALSDAQRHEARLAAKKLRYTAEAFASLYDAEAKPFIKALKLVQNHLGALNDAATASELVARLSLKGPALAAAKRLLAARDAERPATLRAAAKAMDAFADAPTFW